MILPFSFVAEFKPTVGDTVIQEGDNFYFGPQGPDIVEAIAEVTPDIVPEVVPEVVVDPIV